MLNTALRARRTVEPRSDQDQARVIPSETAQTSHPMLRGFGIAFATGVFLAVAFFFIAGTFYAVPGLGYFLIDGYVPAVILVNLAIVLYYQRTHLPGLKRYVGGVIIGVTVELVLVHIGFLLLLFAIVLSGP